MRAFHNDPKLKQQVLEQLKAHSLADEIIKGKYWEHGKGCAVGCTIHSSSHADYEDKFGIPRILAYLEDPIFESLPNIEAKKFPVQFIEAIPVGADLEGVSYKFFARLLKRSRKYIKSNFEIYDRIIELFEEESKDIAAWEATKYATEYAAKAAAQSAAQYATMSATMSVTKYTAKYATKYATEYAAKAAAEYAAKAAQSAAKYAAEYAAMSAAKYAAETEILKQRDDLLELLTLTK